jgi:hypothetical protein
MTLLAQIQIQTLRHTDSLSFVRTPSQSLHSHAAAPSKAQTLLCSGQCAARFAFILSSWVESLYDHVSLLTLSSSSREISEIHGV